MKCTRFFDNNGNFKGFMCGTRKVERKQCLYCKSICTVLCDFPIRKDSKGKIITCDAPMCDECKQSGATKGVDFCEEHFPIAKAKYDEKLQRANEALFGKPKEMSRAEKRGQAISAMGLVIREDGYFTVSTPSLRGNQQHYTVMRNEQGKIRCDCLEFVETIKTDESFRCEHIFAVKEYLITKGREIVKELNNE